MVLSSNKFIFLLIIIFSSIGFSYPDFIRYGYSSCITCHYNGLGGGALNDYGRALFATEITSRAVFSDQTTEEEIANASGFIPKTSLPWWFKPGLKYRGLWFQNNPGSNTSKIEKFINMQSDLNINFLFNQKQTVGLFLTESYITNARRFSTSTEKNNDPHWFSKEYYLRWQLGKNLWIYLGQLEKAFGLRQVDHTYYSRSTIGLGQFDQSQGVIFDVTYPMWNIATHIFLGNDSEIETEKQKGASMTGEIEVADRLKVGASVLSSKNNNVEWGRAAIHSRMGFAKGSGLLTEFGLYQNKLLTTQTSTTGFYSVLHSAVALTRGYHLMSTIQYSKADIKKVGVEKTNWGVGMMTFPIPRTEFRLMFLNGKNYDESAAVSDSWQIQSQLHFSL